MTDPEWVELTRAYWERECWRVPGCSFPWDMVKLCNRALGQPPSEFISLADLEYVAVMDSDGGNYRVLLESDHLYED